MPDSSALTFLTTMAAMSTSVQTFIDHAVKGRIKWLDTATPDNQRNENVRQSVVHAISFATGTAIAAVVGVCPLKYLDVLHYVDSPWVNAPLAGLLVSYGSSFFNETLDGVRAFKKAQEGIRQAQLAQGTKTPDTVS